MDRHKVSACLSLGQNTAKGNHALFVLFRSEIPDCACKDLRSESVVKGGLSLLALRKSFYWKKADNLCIRFETPSE